MSDAAQGALIAGTIGFLSLLITLWFNRRTRQLDLEARAEERRGDNREWYRRTLFEKRLQVVQEAYEWLMMFNNALNRADPKNHDDEWTKKLAEHSLDAREWYNRNAAFLYDSLPPSSEFIDLINSSTEYSQGRTQHVRIWDVYHSADAVVRQRLERVLSAEEEHQQASRGDVSADGLS